MKKIYYLKTCDTCKRILKEITDLDAFELQNIKENPITVSQLEELYKQVNSYEQLFNKRAQLYKKLGLKEQNLTEDDYKNYILQDYTFLSRPVVVCNGKVFVGNSKKTVEQMLEVVNQN